ncbi:MAG: hypothetical protein KY449_00930 [Proteobacteria bacterium]|nr:hypothetical protein [Pseudomonadota bacterium]
MNVFIAAGDMAITAVKDEPPALDADGLLRTPEHRLGYFLRSPPVRLPAGVHRIVPRMKVGRRVWGPGHWTVEANGLLPVARDLNDRGPAYLSLRREEAVEVEVNVRGQAVEFTGVEIAPVLLDDEEAGPDRLRASIDELQRATAEPAAVFHLIDRLAAVEGPQAAESFRRRLSCVLQRDDGTVRDVWRALNTIGGPAPSATEPLSLERITGALSKHGLTVFDLFPGMMAEDRRKLLGQGYQAEFVQASLIHRSYGPQEPAPEFRSSFLRTLADLDRSFQLDVLRGEGMAAYCPVSGRLLRSRHGFCLMRPGSAYIFYRFEGVEVFYVCVGNWPGSRMFIYMPETETLVHMLHPKFRWEPPEDVVREFKVNCVRLHQEVHTYVHGPTRPAAVFRATLNLGHHFWNDLGGIETALRAGVAPQTLEVVQAPSPFMDVCSVFPEIPERRVTRLSTAEAVFGHCLREGLTPVRLTGAQVTATLAERVRRAAAEWGQGARPPADVPRPLIWVNLRAHNKVWVSQAEGYAELLNTLQTELGTVSAYLDGTPDCAGIAAELRARLRPEVTVFEGLDVSLYDSLNWAFAVDAYVVTIGSGLALVTWLADKPGVAHSEWAHLCQLEWWSEVRPGSRPPLAPAFAEITEIVGGMYCNYELDWRRLLQLVRQALGLPPRSGEG